MSVARHIYAVRVKGRKWLAVAGTNSGGCLASAPTVFAAHGIKADDLSVHYGETLVKQKNFAGYAPDYRVVELSESDYWRHYYLQTFSFGYWYKSVEDFLGTFPDAEPYRAELAAVERRPNPFTKAA